MNSREFTVLPDLKLFNLTTGVKQSLFLTLAITGLVFGTGCSKNKNRNSKSTNTATNGNKNDPQNPNNNQQLPPLQNPELSQPSNPNQVDPTSEQRERERIEALIKERDRARAELREATAGHTVSTATVIYAGGGSSLNPCATHPCVGTGTTVAAVQAVCVVDCGNSVVTQPIQVVGSAECDDCFSVLDPDAHTPGNTGNGQVQIEVVGGCTSADCTPIVVPAPTCVECSTPAAPIAEAPIAPPVVEPPVVTKNICEGKPTYPPFLYRKNPKIENQRDIHVIFENTPSLVTAHLGEDGLAVTNMSLARTALGLLVSSHFTNGPSTPQSDASHYPDLLDMVGSRHIVNDIAQKVDTATSIADPVASVKKILEIVLPVQFQSCLEVSAGSFKWTCDLTSFSAAQTEMITTKKSDLANEMEKGKPAYPRNEAFNPAPAPRHRDLQWIYKVDSVKYTPENGFSDGKTHDISVIRSELGNLVYLTQNELCNPYCVVAEHQNVPGKVNNKRRLFLLKKSAANYEFEAYQTGARTTKVTHKLIWQIADLDVEKYKAELDALLICKTGGKCFYENSTVVLAPGCMSENLAMINPKQAQDSANAETLGEAQAAGQ